MSDATVRGSSSSWGTSSINRTLNFPAGIQVGDPVLVAITSTVATTTWTTVPSGWTKIYQQAQGTMTGVAFTKLYASGDGSSITFGANAAYTGPSAIVALDGSVHSGFGILGTIGTRGGAATTTVAGAAGSTTDPNLVLFHEKTTSQTSCVVTPTETDIVNQLPVGAVAGSLYIGSYDTIGGTGSVTATYGGSANTNGMGVQLPATLIPVSGASGTASVSLSAAGGAAAPATSSASLSLSATGALNPGGTASLTLAATASVAARASGSASLALNAFASSATGSLAAWLLTPGPKWAGHRGGFADTYGEFTLQSFNAQKAWNPAVAWNVDVFLSADSQWVASHDSTTGRVLSGTSVTIGSANWTGDIATRTTLVGGNPSTRIDDIVAIAPAGTIWFIDNKQNANNTAFFAKLATLGLTPANTVIKNTAGSTATQTAAKANGFVVWAYAFDASITDITAAAAAGADWVGFDYAGTQPNWNTAIGTGKPSFAHILTSLSDKATADSKAAAAGGSNFGYMVHNVDAVVPAAATGGASLTLSASGSTSSGVAGSASLTLGASGAGKAPVSASASLTLAGTGTAQQPGANGTATLTLTGSGTAKAATTATAALTLAASTTTSSATSGSAAMTLSGTANTSGSTPASGTAALSLTAATTASAPGSSLAALTLAAAGAARGPAAALAALVLTAAGGARTRATGLAQLSLSAFSRSGGSTIRISAPSRHGTLGAPSVERTLAAPSVRRSLTAPKGS